MEETKPLKSVKTLEIQLVTNPNSVNVSDLAPRSGALIKSFFDITLASPWVLV